MTDFSNYTDGRFFNKMSLSTNHVDPLKMFIPIKNIYSVTDYNRIKTSLSVPGSTYFLDNGTLVLNSGEIKNPLAKNNDTAISQKGQDDIIPKTGQRSTDNIFMSNNRRWILYDDKTKYHLLYNPIHSSNFETLIKESNPDLFNTINTRIVAPYCRIVNDRDPLCICSTNDDSKICTTDLLGNSTSINSLDSQSQSNLRSYCNCFNSKCKTSSLPTVIAYRNKNNCPNSIQITVCNQNITSRGDADVKSLNQNCSSNVGSEVSPSPGGSGSGETSPDPTTHEPSFWGKYKVYIIIAIVAVIMLCCLSVTAIIVL
jgi:hypothetical protein